MNLPSQKEYIDILFFGDIVGKPGRLAVNTYLRELGDIEKPDVVIANVENSSNGFGMNKKHYDDIRRMGVDILTSGNHIWDRKEIYDYVDEMDRLLRPHNFPSTVPGVGARVFEINGFKIGVLNLIGQVFMGNYNSPWESLDAVVPEMLHETSIIFVDLHAETTAEKNCMGWYASGIGVSAFVGTHTHVQTDDGRILKNRMGYLTDAGFNGAHESVIGMSPEHSLLRLKYHQQARLEVPDDSETCQVNAVRYTVSVKTGICTRIERVNRLIPTGRLLSVAEAETTSTSQ